MSINTLANKKEKHGPGYKLSRDCANVYKTQHAKLAIFGHPVQPQCLHRFMEAFSIIWYHLKKVWFTNKIFSDCFTSHVVQVSCHEIQDLEIACDEVKALLDNALMHLFAIGGLSKLSLAKWQLCAIQIFTLQQI